MFDQQLPIMVHCCICLAINWASLCVAGDGNSAPLVLGDGSSTPQSAVEAVMPSAAPAASVVAVSAPEVATAQPPTTADPLLTQASMYTATANTPGSATEQSPMPADVPEVATEQSPEPANVPEGATEQANAPSIDPFVSV